MSKSEEKQFSKVSTRFAHDPPTHLPILFLSKLILFDSRPPHQVSQMTKQDEDGVREVANEGDVQRSFFHRLSLPLPVSGVGPADAVT